MVARYMRYAAQIERLLARRGKKWKKIECVRQRQRRLMIALLSRPAAELNRALRRVKPHVLDESALEEYECGDGAQVYAHVHPLVKSSY